jgi:hypothetical protein
MDQTALNALKICVEAAHLTLALRVLVWHPRIMLSVQLGIASAPLVTTRIPTKSAPSVQHFSVQPVPMMCAAHAKATEWDRTVTALQDTLELQLHAQPALLNSVVFAVMVVLVIHVPKMRSLKMVLASASLGITYLDQLALLATPAIHLSSVKHQEPIHHVKTILLLRVVYAPALMDTISWMMSVLFALVCVEIAVTLLVAQVARMVQEMMKITVNALMDTMSPIKPVPSAV